jgi:hypothetical protein
MAASASSLRRTLKWRSSQVRAQPLSSFPIFARRVYLWRSLALRQEPVGLLDHVLCSIVSRLLLHL